MITHLLPAVSGNLFEFAVLSDAFVSSTRRRAQLAGADHHYPKANAGWVQHIAATPTDQYP